MATLKLDNARFVVSMDPERRIIRDGTVVIDGQRITAVGKSSELREVQADRVIDARDMVVTPGFCNGHMHLSYGHATRAIFPDDLGIHDYLITIYKLQAAVTEEEEYYISLLAITELLKYGTTCFLDPGSTKYLDSCMRAYEESGCRIIVGRQNADLPNAQGIQVASTDECARIMEEVVQKYNGLLDGRMSAWTMPYSSEYSTPELVVAAKGLADKYQTGFTLHRNSSPRAIENHQQRFGKRPVQHLEDIGVLGPNVLLSHVVGCDESEIECMARTGTKTTICPNAAMKTGAGIGSRGLVPEMLDRGVCVGLGTDSCNISNVTEILRCVYLSAILFKDARQDTRMVPAEAALEMGTIQGAISLGLGDEIGSVGVGKKADLVMLDTKRPEWSTLFNPVNSLVYNADGRSVHTVIVDGRIVVEAQKPVFVDEWELMQRVQAMGEGLMARTGVSFPQRWPVI